MTAGQKFKVRRVAGDATEHMRQGREHLRAGRFDEAQREFEAAVVADPTLPGAHLALGMACFEQEDFAAALDHFRDALALKPDFAPALMMSAKAHQQMGNVRHAIEDFEEVASHGEGPRATRAQLRSIALLIKEGDLDMANRQVSDLLSTSPQSLPARLAQATIQQQQGRGDDAIANLESIVKIQPDAWPAHFRLGVLLTEKGKVAPAFAHLSIAARLKPDNERVQKAFAHAALAHNQTAVAEAALRQVVELNPRGLKARLKLVRVLAQERRFDEALTMLRAILRRRPATSSAHRLMADIFVDQGNFEEAVAAYVAAVTHLRKRDGVDADKLAVFDAIIQSDDGTEERAYAFRAAFGEFAQEVIDARREQKGAGGRRRLGLRRGAVAASDLAD